MSAAEIAHHRHGPEALAAAYAEEAGPFLGALRSLRGRAVHGGHDSPLVFVTDRGFATSKHEPHVILKPQYDYSDRLVSRRPVLAHLVMTTFDICNRFGELISKIIRLPDDLAPDFHLFIRTAHGAALMRC